MKQIELLQTIENDCNCIEEYREDDSLVQTWIGAGVTYKVIKYDDQAKGFEIMTMKTRKKRSIKRIPIFLDLLFEEAVTPEEIDIITKNLADHIRSSRHGIKYCIGDKNKLNEIRVMVKDQILIIHNIKDNKSLIEDIKVQKPYVIIPDNEADESGYKDEELLRIPFTYLHGELQDDVGFDCYSFLHEAPEEDGIYPCKYKDRDCTFYMWERCRDRKGGLIVYSDNKEDNNYAFQMYNEKAFNI